MPPDPTQIVEPLFSALLEAAHGEPMGDELELLKRVIALQRRGDRPTFELTVKWCRTGDSVQRALGARVLSELGIGADPPLPFRTESLPVLEMLLGDADPAVISAAAIAVGRLALPELLPSLLRLSTHTSASVRHAVAGALGGSEDTASISTLIQMSSDPDAEVRNWATFGLGTMTDADSSELREALFGRIQDVHDETRWEALLGLARRNDNRVVPYIRSELQADVVAVFAVEAALEAGFRELLPALRELATWWDLDSDLLADALSACGGLAIHTAE